MLTNVCGIVTPASNGLPVRSSNKSGGFCCPRCNSQYTRPRSVKDHFITCVNKHGNPNGLSWWDHATLADTQAWHFAHLPTVKEEDEYESEEDEGDQAYGNEEEQNEEEEGDGDVQEQIEVDDGAAAGEEDHEGDSRMGDEERGRDDSIPP